LLDQFDPDILTIVVMVPFELFLP